MHSLTIVLEWLKQKVNRIKGEIHKSIVITKDIETSFLIVDKTKIQERRKQASKKMEDLSNTIDT